MNIGSAILDLIFPRLCRGCGQTGGYLCALCASRIPLSLPECPVCRTISAGGQVCPKCASNLAGLTVATSFELPLVQDCVHLLKYQNIRSLAAPLATLWKRCAFPALATDTLIAIVPSSRRRRRCRGYNQAELLAAELTKILNFPLKCDTLRKERNTVSQMSLSRADRLVNLREAFRCTSPDVVRGRTFIIVDDVCTTGATLEECARALRHAGAHAVWGCVLARGKN